MSRSVLLVVGLGPLVIISNLLGAEPKEFEPLLAAPIVGKTLPLAEVQRYCEERVVRMPAVKTLAEWQAEADRLRAAVLERVMFRGEAAKWRDAQTKVEWLDTIPGGPGYQIKKLRYEALPGMWIPALLYEPEKLAGKVPVILNVNGHAGAPGKALPYKQIRCINQAKRGMLALNLEWIGMGQLGAAGFHHGRMNQLDLCGTSGLAPHYLSLTRALDLLLGLPNADPERVAVTGLSGGGWQTIVVSALDARVTLANPVAGYSSFLTRVHHLSDLGDSEQTPTDLAATADYLHLTALRAPRPTLLTKNSKDQCCFASAHALLPLLEAARPIFKLYGREEALRWHVNDVPGTHNYELDNRQAFYRMLGDFFYKGSKEFDAKEIPSDKEVRTKDQLDVPLPTKNHDFNSLAKALIEALPRDATPPQDPAALGPWQQARRAVLRELVKAKDYQVTAIKSETQEKGPVRAVFWRLQMGGAWTVPAVELIQGEPKKTALVLADAGREKLADQAARLLGAGYRTLVVDPFYLGESRIADRNYLWMLLVSSVGERPLGIQASQVAAVARWASGPDKNAPVEVVAVGPRAGTIALVAAALEDKAVASVEMHQPLKSLKEVIDGNWTFDKAPELFCFGLLERFDIETLKALVTPRKVSL